MAMDDFGNDFLFHHYGIGTGLPGYKWPVFNWTGYMYFVRPDIATVNWGGYEVPHLGK